MIIRQTNSSAVPVKQQNLKNANKRQQLDSVGLVRFWYLLGVVSPDKTQVDENIKSTTKKKHDKTSLHPI